MSIQCRCSNCQWLGTENDIFYHIDSRHRELIREPKGRLFFDLSFKDLEHETLILVCPNALYWFCQQDNILNYNLNAVNGIMYGIFHIGESEIKEYTIKLLNWDNEENRSFKKIWGPYKTQKDNPPTERKNDIYEVLFEYSLFDESSCRNTSNSAKLRLQFDEFKDTKSLPVEDNLTFFQGWSIEQLICIVCLEYIRKNARFCENKHMVCLSCFDAIRNCGKLRCPTCRGWYLYDCSSDKLELWLGQIKWPDCGGAERKEQL